MAGLDFTSTGCEGHSDSVTRLYAAGLGQGPEEGGFEYWLTRYTQGAIGLPAMSDYFAASPEFVSKYGDLTQDGYIRLIYQNVLKREGDSGGITYWNGRMDDGMTRGSLLLSFAESPENIQTTGTVTPTLGVYNKGLTGPWTCGTWTPPSPGDSKNCGSFATRMEAQAWFDYYYPAFGDISKLDGDNNLLVCESYRY